MKTYNSDKKPRAIWKINILSSQCPHVSINYVNVATCLCNGVDANGRLKPCSESACPFKEVK